MRDLFGDEVLYHLGVIQHFARTRHLQRPAGRAFHHARAARRDHRPARGERGLHRQSACLHARGRQPAQEGGRRPARLQAGGGPVRLSTRARCAASCPAGAQRSEGPLPYCHPLRESFTPRFAQPLAGLAEGGAWVDLCDLYAERFDPIMSEDQCGAITTPRERDRHRDLCGAPARAEALVVQCRPGGLGRRHAKVFLDKVLAGFLRHVGSAEHQAAPRAGVRRRHRDLWRTGFAPSPWAIRREARHALLPRSARREGTRRYHALYHMNVATEDRRKGFIAEVRKAMVRSTSTKNGRPRNTMRKFHWAISRPRIRGARPAAPSR